MPKLSKGRLVVFRDPSLTEQYEKAASNRKYYTFDQMPKYLQRRLRNVKLALIKFFNMNENAVFMVTNDYVTGHFRDKEMYEREPKFAKLDARYRTFDGKINASTKVSAIDLIIIIDDSVYEPEAQINVADCVVNLLDQSKAHTVIIP